ncbi:MAG: NADH-quinone oxidoreductase subunit J [Burkholderiales bacterium]
MDPQTLLFYLFATVTVVAALRVVTARNPVHSALFLVLTFFSAAAIWLLLRAEFLAITLVLVYVGAVMVLFLFVVMMVDINLDRMREGFWRNLPVAGFVGALIVLELAAVLWQQFARVSESDAPRLPADYDNTKALGSLIYTEYVYPFEIAAVLLLVAIVAAIALTLRRRQGVKGQNPSEQVRVKASDRLRIVRMPAERPEPETPAASAPGQESKS